MFDRVGGKPFFDELTRRFYEAVSADERLRPMYPADLTEAREHLRDFLVQYWGGPGDYSEVRGHPRLRMRHAPFAIGAPEKEAWFRHMAAAVTAAGLAPEDEQEMLTYFASAATHLVNRV